VYYIPFSAKVADESVAMLCRTAEPPDESEVRFLGYRLEVISQWADSQRKLANAEAISRRLTSIARSALVRPGGEDLLQLSCRLLDDFFTVGESGAGYLPSTENASSTLPGMPPLVAYPDSTNSIPPPMAGPGPSKDPPRAGTPLTDW